MVSTRSSASSTKPSREGVATKKPNNVTAKTKETTEQKGNKGGKGNAVVDEDPEATQEDRRKPNKRDKAEKVDDKMASSAPPEGEPEPSAAEEESAEEPPPANDEGATAEPEPEAPINENMHEAPTKKPNNVVVAPTAPATTHQSSGLLGLPSQVIPAVSRVDSAVASAGKDGALNSDDEATIMPSSVMEMEAAEWASIKLEADFVTEMTSTPMRAPAGSSEAAEITADASLRTTHGCGGSAAAAKTKASTKAASKTPAKKDEAWNSWLEKLRLYKKQHGTTLVPQTSKNHRKLGEWVHRQRVQYVNLTNGEKSSLNRRRIKSLRDLGFVFEVRQRGGGSKPKKASKSSKSSAIIRPGQTSSPTPSNQSRSSGDVSSPVLVDLTVPSEDDTKTSAGSSARPGKQEECHLQEAREETLPPAKQASSSKKSAAPSNKQDIWNVRLEELCRYKEEFGDFAVPQKCNVNPKLGYWVSEQRKQYNNLMRGKTSSITPERIRALYATGFPFPQPPANLSPILHVYARAPLGTDTWSIRLHELCCYRQEHGNFSVPQKYKQNPKLGYWVSEQRKQLSLLRKGKKNSLTSERLKILFEIGFTCDQSRSVEASASSGQSKQVARKNVPLLNKKENDGNIASARASGCIQAPASQSGKDNTVAPGNSSTSTIGAGGASLDEMRKTLNAKDSAVAPGNSSTSTTSAGGASLNKTSKTEDASDRTGAAINSPAYQQDSLATIKPTSSTMPSAASPKDAWTLRFGELCRYKEEHGDCMVPREYPHNKALANWVHQQRSNYANLTTGRQSTLTPERVRKLHTMGFVWNCRSVAAKASNTKRTSAAKVPPPSSSPNLSRMSLASKLNSASESSLNSTRVVSPSKLDEAASTSSSIGRTADASTRKISGARRGLVALLENALKEAKHENEVCGKMEKQFEIEKKKSQTLEEERNELKSKLETAQTQLEEAEQQIQSLQKRLSDAKSLTEKMSAFLKEN